MSRMDHDGAVSRRCFKGNNEMFFRAAFIMIMEEWCGCLLQNGVNESLSRLEQ